MRVLVSVLVGALIVCAAVAQEEAPTVAPPPIMSVNIYDNTVDAGIRAMYMDYDFISGGGAVALLSYGLTDRLALAGNLGKFNLGGSVEIVDVSASVLAWGGGAVYEVYGGNLRNAAGDITDRRPTVSVFGGLQMIHVKTVADIKVDPGLLAMAGLSSRQEMTENFVFINGGAAADIPVVDWLSLIPFASVMAGETMVTSLGADIVVRPFRNDPNWQISVGTVLQQVQANTEGSRLFMAGLSYTASPTFSRTRVGPVLD